MLKQPRDDFKYPKNKYLRIFLRCMYFGTLSNGLECPCIQYPRASWNQSPQEY